MEKYEFFLLPADDSVCVGEVIVDSFFFWHTSSRPPLFSPVTAALEVEGSEYKKIKTAKPLLLVVVTAAALKIAPKNHRVVETERTSREAE